MRLDYRQCWYCDGLISGQGRGDHFPVPKRHGGVLTVPCCTSCHDMKDRFPLEAWPAEWIEAMLADFPKLSRETRLFLAKAVVLLSDHMADQ